jgi:hypothetical protein
MWNVLKSMNWNASVILGKRWFIGSRGDGVVCVVNKRKSGSEMDATRLIMRTVGMSMVGMMTKSIAEYILFTDVLVDSLIAFIARKDG